MSVTIAPVQFTETEVTQEPARLLSAAVRAILSYGGFKQEDLAEALHMSRSAINQRLTNRTDWSLNEVVAIEKALRLKPGILLDAARGKGIIEILARPEGLEPPTF